MNFLNAFWIPREASIWGRKIPSPPHTNPILFLDFSRFSVVRWPLLHCSYFLSNFVGLASAPNGIKKISRFSMPREKNLPNRCSGTPNPPRKSISKLARNLTIKFAQIQSCAKIAPTRQCPDMSPMFWKVFVCPARFESGVCILRLHGSNQLNPKWPPHMIVREIMNFMKKTPKVKIVIFLKNHEKTPKVKKRKSVQNHENHENLLSTNRKNDKTHSNNS